MIVQTSKMCTFHLGHIWKIFSHFRRVFKLDIFASKMLRGCLVCVISNYNSFHSFIFKLCKMIVHSSSYFIRISWFFHCFSGVGGGSDIFFRKILRGCLVYVICNSNSFHFLMLKLCKITVMNMYTLYVVHIWSMHVFSYFLCFWTKTFYPSEMLRGCLVCVICLLQ